MFVLLRLPISDLVCPLVLSSVLFLSCPLFFSSFVLSSCLLNSTQWPKVPNNYFELVWYYRFFLSDAVGFMFHWVLHVFSYSLVVKCARALQVLFCEAVYIQWEQSHQTFSAALYLFQELFLPEIESPARWNTQWLIVIGWCNDVSNDHWKRLCGKFGDCPVANHGGGMSILLVIIKRLGRQCSWCQPQLRGH